MTCSPTRLPIWLSQAPGVIRPDDMAPKIDATQAVICFSEPFYRCLIDGLGLSGSQPYGKVLGAREVTVGNGVAVCLSRYGAPAASMLMEVLIAAGVKRFIMVGTAGSISSTCHTGDVVLTTWGIREEGTSYHYFPPEYKPKVSASLLADLSNWLAQRPEEAQAHPGSEEAHEDVDEEQLEAQEEPLELSAFPRRSGGATGSRLTRPILEGGVWTIDAIFRETLDKAKAYAEQGVLVVEMECTALMCVSAYRKVDFAAVMVVTDRLTEEGWKPDFGGEAVHNGMQYVCSAVARGLLSARVR